MSPESKVRWYEKKENYALLALVLGGVRYFTPPHTVAHQLSDYTITIGLPIAMGYFGVKDGNKYGTPSGLTKKLTNSLTFTKNLLSK